jgi:Helix-turn-helix domain
MTGRYCPCGTALARDNTDRLCAACQARRRRDRAPDVPPEFWQSDSLADALASGDIGRILRAYRCHPFHGQRLPQALVGGWLHMSQPAVCRIETGRRRVTLDEINHIAQVLGMPPIAVPWNVPQPSGEDVDPLSRRSLLGVGAGAALGLNATTAPTAACAIDPELVAHWTKLRKLLARHDAMFGPVDVLPSARHELGIIARHRKLARGHLHTDLLRIEARWAEFASWLSNDAGDRQGRDFWADRALRLAREAGYPNMVAWILLWRSRWATEEQDARHAVAFARAAAGTAGASHRIRALCALKEAHGHALAGDVVACERTLAGARDLLDHDPDDDSRDGLGRRNVTAPYVLADEARCWLWLCPRKAVVLFEEASRLWPSDCASHHGVHQARLALACAAADAPDRAVAEGLKALDIAAATGSDFTMRELRRLDRQLAACDAPVVTDFREAFAPL